MKEPNEWNQRMFPWLYPYGNRMNYLSLWDQPERGSEEDFRRLQEMLSDHGEKAEALCG